MLPAGSSRNPKDQAADAEMGEPTALRVYSKRGKLLSSEEKRMCYFDKLQAREKVENNVNDENGDATDEEVGDEHEVIVSAEDQEIEREDLMEVSENFLLSPNDDDSIKSDGIQLRRVRSSLAAMGILLPRGRRKVDVLERVFSGQTRLKKWVELGYEDVDLNKFVGLSCKVYQPLEGVWKSGRVIAYNAVTNQHTIRYDDRRNVEVVTLSRKRIKFYVSYTELQRLGLKPNGKSTNNSSLDYDELVTLAKDTDECQQIQSEGDIIWAKVTGHPFWPGIILNETCVVNQEAFDRNLGDGLIPVQFFGSHDFARIHLNQVKTFTEGLGLSFHQKCKTKYFIRGLEEVKVYLREHKLPDKMIQHSSDGDGDDEA